MRNQRPLNGSVAGVTARHELPERMLATMNLVTPCAAKASTISPAVSRNARRRLISAAIFAFIFGGGPEVAIGVRPLRWQSRAFSNGVPKNRCSIATQAGLSHRWQTSMPGGIGPLWAAYERR